MPLFAASTITDFMLGFLAPARGFRIVVKNPRLLRYCILPFIIAFIAVGLWMAACVLLARAGVGWVGDMIASDVLRWTVYVLGTLVAIALVIALALVFFFIFIQIVAAPFNTMLAEATESILKCRTPVLESDFWRENAGAVWISLVMLARSLAVAVVALPINLIPVAGTFAYVGLTMFFNCQALGLEFLDYSLERRYASYKERAAWVRSHRSAALGLGGCVSLLLLLPVINLFFLPFCVVGGAELFVRLSERGLLPREAPSP